MGDEEQITTAAGWQERRQEILKWAERGENPSAVRKWVLDCNQDLYVKQYYRAFEADMEHDLAQCAPAFQPETGYPCEEACYDLRRIWRLQLRGYAVFDAWATHKLLAQYEGGFWRVWRLKDLLLLRVGMGIAAGYLILWSSSGLLDFVVRVHDRPAWLIWLSIVQLCTVFALAFSEVERRLSRRPAKVLWSRTLYVVFVAIIQVGFLALLIHYLAGLLKPLCPWAPVWYEPTPGKDLVAGGTALVLAFVFHLFWEDKSLAEPV